MWSLRRRPTYKLHHSQSDVSKNKHQLCFWLPRVVVYWCRWCLTVMDRQVCWGKSSSLFRAVWRLATTVRHIPNTSTSFGSSVSKSSWDSEFLWCGVFCPCDGIPLCVFARSSLTWRTQLVFQPASFWMCVCTQLRGVWWLHFPSLVSQPTVHALHEREPKIMVGKQKQPKEEADVCVSTLWCSPEHVPSLVSGAWATLEAVGERRTKKRK